MIRKFACDIRKLPPFCYSRLPSTGFPILIRRGEEGYSRSRYPNLDTDAQNDRLGVTSAQVKAMVAGSMFGWDCPGADPDAYDAEGEVYSRRFNPKPTEDRS